MAEDISTQGQGAQGHWQDNYKALALWLAPDDVEAGARQIDQAILDRKRILAREDNLDSALMLLAPFLLALGLGFAMVNVIVWYKYDIRQIVPWWPSTEIGLSLAAISIPLMVLLFRRLNRPDRIIRVPENIEQWLEDHDVPPSLQHWHALYWSRSKLAAHRRQFWRFVWWRKTPFNPSYGLRPLNFPFVAKVVKYDEAEAGYSSNDDVAK